jgi:hypothetical protein
MRTCHPNLIPCTPSKLLATLLILAVAWTTNAQQVPSLPPRAAVIKHKADTLARDAKISVIPIQGQEEFGTFVSNDQETFTFYDVDSKAQVTLKYIEVKKLKDGYGGYNSIHQRHTDHTKAMIVAIATAGVIGALLIAVATAKD